MAQQRTVADAMNDLWTKGIKPKDDERALINSPAFTGTPTAPTPSSSDNSTRLATTAFVLQKINQLINSAPGVLDTLGEIATALQNNPNVIGNILTQLSGKLDATTASNFMEKQSYANFRQETNCELYFTSGTSSGIYFQKNGNPHSCYLRGDGNFVYLNTGPNVNSLGPAGITIQSADTGTQSGRVTIRGTELYFNNTKLA